MLETVQRRRTYAQACNIARALDLVGERWTLLLLRELSIGPRSYGQLETALPGIGTNLLADRLKRLESDGLIRREPVPDSSRSQYALSDAGKVIEPVLVELERFGLRVGLAGSEDDFHRSAWSVLSTRATFVSGEAAGLNEQYEFHVDDEVFHLGVRGGVPANGMGPAVDPIVATRMTSETFRRVREGSLTMAQGVWTGEIEVVAGHAAALDRCDRIFGMGHGLS